MLVREHLNESFDLSFKKSITDLNLFIDNEMDKGSTETDQMILDSVYNSKKAYVIYKNKRPIGFIDYKIKEDFILIDWLYIGYNNRRQGIGKQTIVDLYNQFKIPIVLHPFTNESEEAFIKQGFYLDPDFDELDPNTLIYKE